MEWGWQLFNLLHKHLLLPLALNDSIREPESTAGPSKLDTPMLQVVPDSEHRPEKNANPTTMSDTPYKP